MSLAARTSLSLHVLGVGACSPLGTDGLALTTAARSGLFEPRPTPWGDQRGDAVGMVQARFLPSDLVGLGRFVALGAAALREAAEGGPELDAPLPLLLALPETERPDVGDWAGPALLAALARESRVALDLERSEVVRAGHAGFGLVLERAAERLAAGACGVLVGGIDSYYHPEALRWLDRACRLHSLETENGLIPGEGAAFALLGRADAEGLGQRAAPSTADHEATMPGARAAALPQRPAAPRALILHSGFDLDPSALEPSAPALSRVSTELVRSACSAVGAAVRWVWSDVNGERHRIREWSHVSMRCAEWLAQSEQARLPETMGDVGAASGALALALCVTSWTIGAAPGRVALVSLCSEGAERAAFVVAETADGAADHARWQASVGTPALHHLETRAGARAGAAMFADELGQHLSSAALGYLTEIAALGRLRVPLDSQTWSSTEPMKQRLLACLDALVALGWPAAAGPPACHELLTLLESFVAQALVPDPGRQFARAFTLGCLGGELAGQAALAPLARAIASSAPGAQRSGLHAVDQAVADALSLASSPLVGPLARQLLLQHAGTEPKLGRHDAPEPRAALVLLEVLRFRGELSIELLEELIRIGPPSISAAAVHAFGFVDAGDQAVRRLQALVAAGPAARTALAAASSLVRLGAPEGLQAARCAAGHAAQLSPAGRLGYLRLLALNGRSEDLPLVRQLIAPSARAAELCGWFGHVELVPWLLATLGQANAARSGASAAADSPELGPSGALELAAAEALDRITGAALRDPTADEQPDEPEQSPCRLAAIWIEWWHRHGGRFDPDLRYRFGAPYRPEATLDELGGPSLAKTRRDGALELACSVGPLRFEPTDLVARQRSSLEAARPEVARVSALVPPGRANAATARGG